MEIIGDDKRIRALFSEARLSDEQAAENAEATGPSGTTTWCVIPAHIAWSLIGRAMNSPKVSPAQ